MAEWDIQQKTDLAPMLAGQLIQDAIQDQRGLKLERRKAPIEILIVDHAEKTPTEN